MEDYRLEQSGQQVQDILNGAAMQSDLTAETERATEAEQTLQGNIDIEERDRKAADLTLQGNIDAEELRAKAAEKQNADDIDALEEKVPSGASASNKLATESYVDDSVATATATFRGTYNLVSDLHLTVNATEQQIATALALAISTADNNDYCFVQVPTSSETPTEIKEIDRYKFNGTAWSFEYKLNNSGFTTAQWAAINSGITSGDVSKLAALPTNAQLTTLLAGKQDVLTFDNVPTEGSSHPVKSGGVYSAIDDEKTARETADSSLSSAIEAILLLIPSAATSLNKLADKAFVNSSIATASATFRGTYNLVTDLSLTVSATRAQIATALAGAVSDEDNNDYAFVQIPTSDATPTQIAKTERYKFNGTAWEYEYDLNNSGYTAAQWAAINSGITEALVTKLSALPTNTELTSALGVLTSSITTINQKIPSAASQANQLVDTAAMESYIVQVLDVLTASFNVTSTDGHVTVSISQVDGKITSVSVSTSDIASAASLSLIAGRVTTAEGNISTNAADIANLQDAYAALTQSALVVVQPTDTWPVASPATKTIYRVVDRVNTPPQNYSDYMWNGSAMVLMATYDNAIDDVVTVNSNNLVKSGGIVSSVYDANALTDNLIVNRIIKNIIYNDSDLNYGDRKHILSIGVLIGGRYYNRLYLRWGSTNSHVVLEKNFATLSEAVADFKANPFVCSSLCCVEFNTDVVGNESLDLDFQFVNKVDLRYNNSIYTNLILRKELFKVPYSEGNALIAEILHFEPDGYYLDNIVVYSFATINSDTGKYVINLQSVYTKEGDSTRFGTVLNYNFDTRQEALDYWNENIGGHILPMADGRGYVLYNKLDSIEMIPMKKDMRLYLDKDASLLENAPRIVNYIGGLNNLFLFDTKLNLLVDELYINPSEIDYSTINEVRISIGGTIGGTIYNLVYVYRTGGLSTRVLWQQNYDTVAAAISDFKGIHGNIYGYIKANDKFVEQFYKGFSYDVQLSQLNVTRLSLEQCPKIAEYINPINALANKNVVWEGDSIAAGNAYGNEAWRRPIELKYGMIGVNYSRGGATFTCNLPDLDPVNNISARIDAEVAANPNMQYFIFNGGTNDADRIGKIVQWKPETEDTIHERKDPSTWPAKFGTWNDTDFSGNYDKDTFCGALEYVIWKVMSSCRYVKIGYIVSPKMGDSSGLTFFNRLEYFREAMAICKKWGVPVINLWEDSWMNSNMPNQYDPSLPDAADHVANGDFYVDTQHPAPAGYDYLSKLIGEWMNEL